MAQARSGRVIFLLVASLLLIASPSHGQPYHLLLDADASPTPASVMLETQREGRTVYRHIVPPAAHDAPGRVTARIVAASDSDTGFDLLLEAELDVPAHLPAAVELDSEAETLRVLDGLWHLFSYDAAAHAPDRVNLAGSFNGWSTTATPMIDRGDGTYRALKRLDEGVHFYKFVLDGDQWHNDPASDHDLEQPDGHGGVNSAVLVGLDGRDLPAPEPGAIRAQALRHDPASITDRNVVSDTMLRLMARAQHGDVEHAYVRFQAGDGDWQRLALHRVAARHGFKRFGHAIVVDEGAEAVRYVFEFTDGPATVFLASGDTFTDAADAKASAYTSDMDVRFETPEWARHVVWYQIFPERFRNGAAHNDPPNTFPWTSKWYSTLEGESGDFYGRDVWARRFGGDVQGLIEKLPYLRRLGVDAIYLNPVFQGDSMHKYDASDFRHIEPYFGFAGDIEELEGETDDPATWQWSRSDKLFLEFVAEARRQGFRVIIDGVWNHVGTSHYAFQDVLEHGRDSRYADWFAITSWGSGGRPGTADGIQWRAWDGPNGALPVFRQEGGTLAPGPREHVMAITRRWLAPDGDASRGVDGFRLDVANEVPHDFWREWRDFVKEINPDAIIVGEIWSRADPWLAGDQFDSVMNYQFAMPAQRFFVNRRYASSPRQFVDELQEWIHGYPYQASLVMQNLFDSHDTDRLASMFVNPDLPYNAANRPWMNNPDYSTDPPEPEHWTRLKQAAAFQMAMLGAPMIYYGTEAGMYGADDPDNRQPMVWEDLEPYDDPDVAFRPAVFEHYQRIIAMRRQLEPLRLGWFYPIVTDDDTGVLVVGRDLQGEHVYVVVNRGGVERTVSFTVARPDRGQPLIDWLNDDQVTLEPKADAADARPTLRIRDDAQHHVSDEAGKLTITVPAYGTAVLSAAP